MVHIEATRELTADPQALWSWVVNPNTWHDWFTIHDEWTAEPPEHLWPGARLSARIEMLHITDTIVWTVEQVEAPARVVLHGQTAAGITATFTFTVERNHTIESHSRVSVRADFAGAGIDGPLADTVHAAGLNQLDRTLEALDALASAAA